jgi:poly(A) polymerase
MMPGPRQFAVDIVRILRERGHQAYFAGGCVRDFLLDRTPADYDVATSATPHEVMHIFPETYAVGAQFGVVLVPIPKETNQEKGVHEENELEPASVDDSALIFEAAKAHAIEVATFRTDVSYSDGRHPDAVLFSKDPREDVERRDFTINGLLLDPVTNEVLDFVGGRNDLAAHLIRAIGDPERRFNEDKLRMLRAVRFAARFDYTIESATFAAIQKLAPQISQVSSERARDELTKMLTEGHASQAFRLLDQSNLLRQVLPEISAMKGVEQPPQYHPEGDVFVHTLLLLDFLPHPCPLTLAWGALLHDVGKPATFRVAPDRIRFDGHVEVGVRISEEICRRLRFSNDDTDQILALVENHMRFADVPRMKESTLKRFLRMPRFEEHLELHRLDCSASHRNLSLYELVRDQLATIPEEKMRPAPLLTGDDLIANGYTPGPAFKQILSIVEDAQLEGRLDSKKQALAFVMESFPHS